MISDVKIKLGTGRKEEMYYNDALKHFIYICYNFMGYSF